jgi:preprotein translocase subunit SecG
VFTFVLILHGLLCVAIIGLVLLQQGKGASVGVSFGGGSNTLFGASGAGNVLTKATTTAAVLLMITSLVLIKMYAGGGSARTGAPIDPLKGSVMERSAGEAGAATQSSEPKPVEPVPAAPVESAPAPVANPSGSAGSK